MIQDIGIREKQYRSNINSKGDTRYYNDSCKDIKKYAHEQNTIYDPITNQMLYGINSNMRASGVSDGTCNQINPLMFTPRYVCGAGTAGGNRCAYGASSVLDAHDVPNTYSIENFNSGTNCNGCNTTEFVIFILLVLILFGLIYSKNKNIEL
jgi:hypothetical protein